MELDEFFDPARHGFVRLAVAVPANRVADPAHNAEQTAALHAQASRDGALLVAFPELGLSAYTCDDLFHQEALLAAVEQALLRVAAASKDHASIAIVGLPLKVDHGLYNCAAVVQGGRVLGVVPKSYLPNYGEFYEARQFNPASNAISRQVVIGGEAVPFGADLLFEAHFEAHAGGRAAQPMVFHIEICEDVWVPIPPSSHAALAGATVLVNLSASNITIGKSAYRHALVGLHSARCLAAYLYTSAGIGESTTDMAWDGQSLIYESGELLRESARFATGSHLITADVDLQRLSHERMRQTSFGQSQARFRDEVSRFRRVVFDVPAATVASHSAVMTIERRTEPTTERTTGRPPEPARRLNRRVERFPYVPADPARRDERCREVYDIQVQALVQRLAASGLKKLVIGVSGGLDSTQALLVCAQAMDLMQLPRANILGYTMPGFATSSRTLDQALKLMAAIGCSAQQIDIRPSCEQMLRDIGHPYARGEKLYDVTFENVQAGERTSHLFRLANLHGALVVGTGDLSELALGWCTYGVGDHMAHYNLNASVPKTLIKHLVRWVADSGRLDGIGGGIDGTGSGSAVLHAILDTEISPELVPGGSGETGDDKPSQSTEDSIGPYALHDFFLYYTIRFGFAPSKVAFLAWTAWHDAAVGRFPDGVARHAYSLADIKRHLRTFVWRFFQISQFKRSCVPNGPKVGSGGSLSPRGDWRAPSDGQSAVWLADVERIPDRPAGAEMP